MFKVGDKVIWWFRDSRYDVNSPEAFFRAYGKDSFFEVKEDGRAYLNGYKPSFVYLKHLDRVTLDFKVINARPKGISAFIKRVEKEYAK
jgi:hypothetical protein